MLLIFLMYDHCQKSIRYRNFASPNYHSLLLSFCILCLVLQASNLLLFISIMTLRNYSTYTVCNKSVSYNLNISTLPCCNCCSTKSISLNNIHILALTNNLIVNTNKCLLPKGTLAILLI